jgi:hypothetical protein
LQDQPPIYGFGDAFSGTVWATVGAIPNIATTTARLLAVTGNAVLPCVRLHLCILFTVRSTRGIARLNDVAASV